VIREFTPHFKEGDYSGGVATVTRLVDIVEKHQV
jgi:uncharacterized membrane protein YgcG